MMQALVRSCLKARFLVVIAAAGLMVVGYRASRSVHIDAFPEFAAPMVEVQTEAPGLSSLEVETTVTTPLENVLAGTPFVDTVRSKSVLGMSSIVLLFDRGTDLLVARQMVQERLGPAAATLPMAARAPVMIAPMSSTSRVLKIGLTSETLTQTDISDTVRWTLRPKILAVPGVSNVQVWGHRQRQFDVVVDPARLEASATTLDELSAAVRDATTPISAGLVDGPLQRMALQHITLVQNLGDLAELPIASRNGAVVRVKDVADVQDSYPPLIGEAVVNDVPGVLLVINKHPWGNTLEVTKGVDDVLANLAKAMPGIDVDASVFRPATFIERSIANLEHAMLVGAIFVVLVIAVFAWSIRTAIISVIAIPLSLAIAALVLAALGGTLNTMVLAGLVIALGEVVDDAIIDVENILRRLRENRELPQPKSILEVALYASLEVRSAVVYATLIVVLVFLPVWFLGGVSGAFFRPLAFAYGVCVLASMVVAMTVTPALSVLLLPKELERKGESPVMRWLSAGYERVLPTLLARDRTIIGGGLALIVAAAIAFTGLDSSFLPEFKENDFLMHWVAEPGVSIDAVSRTAQRASKELRAIEGVESFGAHIGRAEAGDEIVGQNFAELWIHVADGTDHEHVASTVRATIDRYPGLRRDLETYLRERIEEVVSGAAGSIVIRLMGPTFEGLREGAEALAARVRDLDGVKNVQVERQGVVPNILVTPREEAAALGFLPGDIRRITSTLVRGDRVGETFREGRSIPILVRGPDSVRQDPSSLRETWISSPRGARARVADVAKVEVSPTPGSVAHEDAERRLDISIHVSGNLGSVAKSVESAVADTALAPGHHAEVLGEWRERSEALRRLLGFSMVSLFLILGVLYVDLQSVRLTALVAASLPFALVGGVAGAWLGGGVLSLGSLVGLVTVLGIAARNGILLVAHYRQLEGEGAEDVVMRGSLERIGPIIMTALATALALVPLVISGNEPGHEIEHPMAVVILGGLVSSTALNLVAMPALYRRFAKREVA